MSEVENPPARRTRRSLRRPAAVVGAVLAALLIPGGWQGAQAESRDIRPNVPGTVLSWGTNVQGQLGDGTTVVESLTPGRVCGSAPCINPLQDVVSVSAGFDFTLALRSDGTVVAWGDNFTGQLGNGSTSPTPELTPVVVCNVGATAPCAGDPLTNVVAVAAGSTNSAALRADGTVVTWGFGGNGELGNGTSPFTAQTTPVQVCNVGATAPCPTNPLTGVVGISAGNSYVEAVRTSGRVVGWGLNTIGQLADGTSTNRNTPVPACDVGQTAPCTAFLSGITSLASGDAHTVARAADGTARAWGVNGFGALGNGTTTFSPVPVKVCAQGATAPCTSFLTGVAGVAAGDDHSAAVLTDGTVRTWGANSDGQLGDGTNTDRSTPAQVCAPSATAPCTNFLTGITAVRAGDDRTLALRADGGVRAWGNNEHGALGDGTVSDRNRPIRVCAIGESAPCARLLEGASDISTGSSTDAGFSLAIVRDTAAVRPLADLALSLSASPEPLYYGKPLTYQITVQNFGPSEAKDVVFTDTLPENARFVSASTAQGSCTTPPAGSTNSVTCSLGTIAADSQSTSTIVVKAVANNGEEIVNTARVSSSTTDLNPNNNSATISTPVH
ncbi:hypothetical protein [Kitasatospora sp. NPDC050543]|uniref:RCC1 domain-containing protein n=1 Tax=Kitasatospora sp. NPDC050543 TaxID=3364054 RepID=UPI0037B44101